MMRRHLVVSRYDGRVHRGWKITFCGPDHPIFEECVIPVLPVKPDTWVWPSEEEAVRVSVALARLLFPCEVVKDIGGGILTPVFEIGQDI